MNAQKIVEQYLKTNGFDGLYSTAGECGCELSDLAPCCEGFSGSCEPGYKVNCTPECAESEHEYIEGGWHVQGEKPCAT